MTFRQQNDPQKLREFLDMVENSKIELRRYKNPVLVWSVKDGSVFYSFWEQDMLDRFGIANVDGWDYEEDQLFCPDWVDDSEDNWDDDLDDDDDDFEGLEDFIRSDKD